MKKAIMRFLDTGFMQFYRRGAHFGKIAEELQ